MLVARFPDVLSIRRLSIRYPSISPSIRSKIREKHTFKRQTSLKILLFNKKVRKF